MSAALVQHEPNAAFYPPILARLINARWFQLLTLLAFALVLNREGDRVPTGNEHVYLLYFYKAWHRSFLSTDWTFQETTAGHAVFNYAVGWLTRLMSLEAAAWVGRVACWTGVFTGLLRLGTHFKIPSPAVWLGIVLWLVERQSPVTRDWMIGSFEAKCIAYWALVFAVDGVLRGKIVLPGVLCGIAFSFHSAVGLWAGAALGVVVLTHFPIRQTLTFSALVIAFSLPGLITSLPLITGPHAISPDEAKYLVTVALPDCFDVATFPHTWLLALAVLPVFGFLHMRWARDRAVRMLFVFELTTAIFFVSGVVARVTGHFSFVQMFPMRVYATFALLFFFWRCLSVATAIASRCALRPVLLPPLRVWGLALVLVLSIPSPMLALRDMLATHMTRFRARPQGMLTADSSASTVPTTGPSEVATSGDNTSFFEAARWISTHTPETDLVIAPPWINGTFYYMHRPLVANWHAPRYNAMTEWRERIESLVGDVSHMSVADAYAGEMDEAARTRYQTLPSATVANLQARYKARWLVTTGDYPMHLVHTSGPYKVYQLP